MQRIELEPVDVPKAPSSAAPGIMLTGGSLILVSGQVAWDAAGNVVGKGDIVAQTRQAFANLERIFAAAEATLADVVKLTIYITDLANRRAVREIRREFLADNNPPSTTVVVSSLVDEDLLIEIDAMGLVPDLRSRPTRVQLSRARPRERSSGSEQREGVDSG